MRLKRCRPGFILVLMLATASTAFGQAGGIYLKFDGIDGESTDDRHRDWIDVLSYQHALTSSFDLGSIGGGGGTARASHEPVRIVKRIDKSTPLLFSALNTGQPIPGATFEFIRPGTEEPYLVVTLQQAYITSYEALAYADGYFEERIAIVYGRIEIEYWVFNLDGTRGGSVRAGWDVIANTSLAIEQESIEVEVQGLELVFNWRTTSESGYYGFEIQHLEQDGYRRAAYVPASGWSSQPLEYEVRIRGLDEGVHMFRLAGLGVDGGISYSDEFVVTLGEPTDFRLQLDAPYPNPASARATVSVSTDRYEDTRVSVWDLLGREVAILHEGKLRPGVKSEFIFEPAESLPSGVYVIRATAGDVSRSQLVTVLR